LIVNCAVSVSWISC